MPSKQEKAQCYFIQSHPTCPELRPYPNKSIFYSALKGRETRTRTKHTPASHSCSPVLPLSPPYQLSWNLPSIAFLNPLKLRSFDFSSSFFAPPLLEHPFVCPSASRPPHPSSASSILGSTVVLIPCFN